MYKSMLLRSSNDNVRAKIQRQQIDRIIHHQKKAKEQQNSKLLSSVSLTNKNKISTDHRRRLSSHSMFRSRKKQLSTSKKDSKDMNSRYNLSDQINYFSVKNHYEKVINATTDRRLHYQLQVELYFPREHIFGKYQQPQSTNFFQRVFRKQSRMQKYFEEVKKHRRQMVRSQLEIGL